MVVSDTLCYRLVTEVNYFKYVAEGGQAKVESGNILGIDASLHKKGEIMISSRVGLFYGSKLRIFVIMLLASSEIWMCSGKE